MENTGLDLMAGAIIIAVLIIGAGMNIYNSAFIDSMDAMSIQEKDDFNNQFTAYEGSQTGMTIKDLCDLLVYNASIYEDEIVKLPKFTIGDKVNLEGDELEDAVVESADDIYDYEANIMNIRSKIEEKHTYFVALTFNEDGNINEITIYYEEP